MDDDPAFRRLAQRILEANGLAVAGEADTAASAMSVAGLLRMAAAGPTDLDQHRRGHRDGGSRQWR